MYGEQHPEVANSLNSIADIYKSQGQYEESLQCYQQSLTMFKAIYGEHHSKVASVLKKINSVEKSQQEQQQEEKKKTDNASVSPLLFSSATRQVEEVPVPESSKLERRIKSNRCCAVL